ncbi:MAG: Gfo/Idh/MocA family oxidoreductase [Spirosomataceae bacterium]
MGTINSRRSFLKHFGGAAAALSAGLNFNARAGAFNLESVVKPVRTDEKIRLGLIGAGIIGHYDLDTALKVPGTEVTAVCDLYEGRRIRAKEKWGEQVFTTVDYRELLARNDVDAVLVCTSDHWHDRISMDAMNAGKHVYCEKPMVHHIEEGAAVIETQKKTGKVFQVGSQRASSIALLKAKEYIEAGAIGDLTFIEGTTDRTDARGAWQYSIPTDASPQTVDWDRYIGDAPKRPFDATRFFRWRNYKDYGTGVAGDLYVHLITGVHVMTGALGPTTVYSVGDVTYWKDGRDASDLMNCILRYPKGEKMGPFQVYLRVNLADGSGGRNATRLVGTEGVIELNGNSFKIKKLKRPVAPGYGGYDSYESFSKVQKEEYAKYYNSKYTPEQGKAVREPDVDFTAPAGYDDRYDHMVVFFNAIRGQGQIVEDATFGLRACAPSLACNLSAEKQRIVTWDPITMKLGKLV